MKMSNKKKINYSKAFGNLNKLVLGLVFKPSDI